MYLACCLDPIEVEYHGEPSDHTSGIASYENLQIHKIEQGPATVSHKMEVELSSPLSAIRARGHRAKLHVQVTQIMTPTTVNTSARHSDERGEKKIWSQLMDESALCEDASWDGRQLHHSFIQRRSWQWWEKIISVGRGLMISGLAKTTSDKEFWNRSMWVDIWKCTLVEGRFLYYILMHTRELPLWETTK